MALTPSTMLELGTTAPDFALKNVSDDKPVKKGDFAGKPLLVMFICNHCPFVKHLRDHLGKTMKDYQAKGLAVVGISANDISTHPDDAPDKMAAEAKAGGYTFPYLYDATQAVAKEYKAACTPDFFLFDKNHKLVYRGQYDETRPDKGTPTGADLKAAMDAVLAGKPAPAEQKPSIGCNIKWKAGNEPAYFKS
ncbi:MAG: thioredoxin family protein [Gemmataceae bacterium]